TASTSASTAGRSEAEPLDDVGQDLISKDIVEQLVTTPGIRLDGDVPDTARLVMVAEGGGALGATDRVIGAVEDEDREAGRNATVVSLLEVGAAGVLRSDGQRFEAAQRVIDVCLHLGRVG